MLDTVAFEPVIVSFILCYVTFKSSETIYTTHVIADVVATDVVANCLYQHFFKFPWVIYEHNMQ